MVFGVIAPASSASVAWTGTTWKPSAMPRISGQCGVRRMSSSPGSHSACTAHDSAWVAPHAICTPAAVTSIAFRVRALSAIASTSGAQPLGLPYA